MFENFSRKHSVMLIDLWTGNWPQTNSPLTSITDGSIHGTVSFITLLVQSGPGLAKLKPAFQYDVQSSAENHLVFSSHTGRTGIIYLAKTGGILGEVSLNWLVTSGWNATRAKLCLFANIMQKNCSLHAKKKKKEIFTTIKTMQTDFMDRTLL